MVECEYNYVPIVFIEFLVLIDTWWNVNWIARKTKGWAIDGFNRYMVECE